MAEKEKSQQAAQTKNVPKDGQVIMAIMKEMGIKEFDSRTIIQLTEFVYRYATSILDEARMYANNSKKKFLDVEDVRLALQLTSECTFTTPPPREVVLECANIKNYTALPLVKPHCGLRLPPDRYCLSACNYALKSCSQKKPKASFPNPGNGTGGAMKVYPKTNQGFLKKVPSGGSKQSVSVPKPLTKITTVPPKTSLKPKIQISGHNVHLTNATNGIPMDTENNLKRKRDGDNDIL